MSLKIYSTPNNPRTNKILVAASLANIEIQVIPVNFQDLEKPEYLQKNPLGKVPVLETQDGFLSESNAILLHVVANTPLEGTNQFNKSKVKQWLDFTSMEYEPNFVQLQLGVKGYKPLEAKDLTAYTTDVAFKLKVLDDLFKGSNYLVGDALTVADIALASYVQSTFTTLYGEENRKGLPNLVRWFEHISSIPQFLQVFGRTRYCKNSFKQQEVQAAVQQPQVAPKQQQQAKAAPAPKEKKVVEKAEKAEEEEEKPKKVTDPLDLLPATTFDVDAWKRQFLASQNLKAEFEWFWQNLDVQGWSVWELQYQKMKPDEFVMQVQAKNNCRGFLQRTDPHFRKYSFAVHGVYGEEKNYELKGAWLWRGTEIPQQFKDHPTFEYITFKKLDTTKAEDKALFEEYWLNQVEDESKVQGLTTRFVEYYR